MKAHVLAFLLMVFASSASAGVTYYEDTRSLVISGQTNSLQLLLARVVFSKNDVASVYLSGPGGAYYVGLEMGKEIKASNARVVINADCASACAFAAIAASDIIMDQGGRLLFHRPYVTQVPSLVDIDNLAGQYGGIYLSAAKYLLEHGYTFQFGAILIAQTSPCILLSFTDVDLLLRFKGAPLDQIAAADLPRIPVFDACTDNDSAI